MLYRTMLDNENMDMQDPQYLPNVNETIPMQQSQMGSQFMGYPMMDEMYDPSTYGYQIPQQQFQIPEEDEEDNKDMNRAPKNHNSYQHGYNEGYNHGYGHGYNHGYNHYKNNQNFPFFPLLFPFLFFRD